MTRDDFSAAFKPLRALRGWPMDGELAKERLAIFWDQFQHADAESFARGCARAVKTRTFFPTPAELFADCEMAAPRETWTAERHVADVDAQIVYIPNSFGGEGLRLTVSKVWEYHCDDCDDGGQVSFWCGAIGPTRKPWQLTVPCGNREDHTGHEYVGRCACWDRNPALIRKRALQAQHARGGKESAA